MKRRSGPPRIIHYYTTPQAPVKNAQRAPQEVVERHQRDLYRAHSMIEGLIIALREDPDMPAAYLARWRDILSEIDELID